MPTECSRKSMSFARVEGRDVVADFGGGAITSDAGALLLGATDRAIGLVDRFAACFSDGRTPGRVVHEVATLVGQRVFAIALGYEDLVGHDDLRRDPALGAALGRLEARRPGPRGQEHAEPPRARAHRAGSLPPHRPRPRRHRGAVRRSVPRRPREAPARITLDLDATDDPIHGRQEGRVFHGYYDCTCYLPLYIFCGDHLLAAKLRRSNIDASAGATEEVARIVERIRARWPRVKILLRADSGFAREALMARVARQTGWISSSASPATHALSITSISTSPGPRTRRSAPAAPPAASPTSAGARSTAGAASAASSPRPSGCPGAASAAPTHASS